MSHVSKAGTRMIVGECPPIKQANQPPGKGLIFQTACRMLRLFWRGKGLLVNFRMPHCRSMSFTAFNSMLATWNLQFPGGAATTYEESTGPTPNHTTYEHLNRPAACVLDPCQSPKAASVPSCPPARRLTSQDQRTPKAMGKTKHAD